ncbi:hypothetical protein BDW62DRAFT_61093 [Aspergillus aurantiobrunneus]
MPRRETLDILIQYFIYELNWMKQLVHAPSFLMQYQQWWNKDSNLTANNVELQHSFFEYVPTQRNFSRRCLTPTTISTGFHLL